MIGPDFIPKKLVTLAILCAIGMVTIFLSYRFLNHYLVITSPLEKADAIVLMAGNDTGRLSAVVDLYQRGYASTVLLTNDGIFSAWSKEYARNLYQVEWTRLKLIKNGVPSEAIIELKYTQSGTYFDALNTKAFVQKNNIKSLLIVTSDYHTLRTLWSFEKIFQGDSIKLNVYPAKIKYPVNNWMAEVRRFKTLLYEFLKLNYYKCRFDLFTNFTLMGR